jgi:ribulose-bisphosphate carboxylase large chain
VPLDIQAIYRIRSNARSITERARTIPVEQSVEMPLEAIDDPFVNSEIVGRVLDIKDLGKDLFEVRIALATATIGSDAGQLLNMLFGNTSIHDDVMLHDVKLPSEFVRAFEGPRHGIDGLRRRVGAQRRALLLGAQAAGCLRMRWLRSRSRSRGAASTTSRMITVSPTKPIRRLRHESRRSRPRCAGTAR